MKRFIKSHILLSFVFALSAVAAPVHLDTPEAHIIVTRPIDRWSADSVQRAESAMWTREFAPAVWGMTPRPQVSQVWLTWTYLGDSSRKTDIDSNTPMMNALREGVVGPRYKVSFGDDAWKFYIRNDALQMSPKQAEDFVSARALAFKTEVQEAVLGASGQSIFSTVARAGSVAVSIGANVAGLKALDGSSLPVGGMGIGSGTASNDFLGVGSAAFQLVTNKQSITPPIVFDFSPYLSVQYRSIELVGPSKTKVFGDIYIAYKSVPSPETQALISARAVLLAIGMGASQAEIDAARSEELVLREKIRSSLSATAASK